MIAKLSKGRGFRGVAEYLLRRERGAIIGGNMAGQTPRELAREFGELRKLRPTLGRAVAHYSLSLPADDRRPDDAEWAAIAQRFIEEMGFLDCPFVVVRHDDTDHHHIHILASRISLKGSKGEVVSDRNDFHRAEVVLRCIEAEHGFRPVPTSTKKTNNRRSTMNNKNITTTAAEPIDTPELAETDVSVEPNGINAISCLAGDNPSERKRREMRRAIRDPGYDQLVASLIGPQHLKHIHHHQRGAVIYTNDGGRINDDGDRITAYNMEHKLAAQRIVALAVSRGWTAIFFTGPDEFLREAMMEARTQGLPVRAKDAHQQAILQEILDAESGAVGVALTIEATPEELMPAPEPTPEPAPLDLASRLQRRREENATPQPTHTPRTPGLR